ncbi:MAG: hypothetical protein HFI38_11920 [Lachnospiraceae bacterium]|nr:hypothetical protein [Lachnospiraceae bacterium]
MKKTISVYVLALCLLAAFAAGCGGKDDNTVTTAASGTSGETTASPASDETTAAPVAAQGGFYFSLNGAAVSPGMEQDALLSALGDADNVFQAPSCAGEGTDYTYTYGGVEIATVPDAQGVNRVNAIVLKDDLSSTPEGVSLFMTMADMTAAYGEDYTSSGNAYTYARDNTLLQFIVEGDEITSIQYLLEE